MTWVRTLLLILAASLTACTSAPQPARLAQADARCLQELESGIRQLGGGPARLTAQAFSDSDTLLLEPATALRLDGRVLCYPAAFRLRQQGSQCLLLAPEGHTRALAHCGCRPLHSP